MRCVVFLVGVLLEYMLIILIRPKTNLERVCLNNGNFETEAKVVLALAVCVLSEDKKHWHRNTVLESVKAEIYTQ